MKIKIPFNIYSEIIYILRYSCNDIHAVQCAFVICKPWQSSIDHNWSNSIYINYVALICILCKPLPKLFVKNQHCLLIYIRLSIYSCNWDVYIYVVRWVFHLYTVRVLNTLRYVLHVWNYIMAGHAIVVVNDIILLFYHGNAVILTLRYWWNDGKWFVWCKFNYINNHLWLVKNNNHLKPRYTEVCNFLTKRAWVSQQCTLVVAKDFAFFEFISVFGNDYPCNYIIHTQHDCPSQMNSNLLISVTKLTRYRSLIC